MSACQFQGLLPWEFSEHQPANQTIVVLSGNYVLSIVVEASPDLAHPAWTPVATNTLVNGTAYFGDPQWVNYPARYYRLQMP